MFNSELHTRLCVLNFLVNNYSSYCSCIRTFFESSHEFSTSFITEQVYLNIKKPKIPKGVQGIYLQ